jgi:DNA-binding MarR family transcriptional regulator
LDRNSQIETILQSFHLVRIRLIKGPQLLSSKSKIPQSQWLVLRLVYQNEGINIKELAGQLGISSSAATQLVDSLVKKGYLERKSDLEDRRMIKIKLSSKSHEMMEKQQTRAFEQISSLFDILSDDELRQYSELSQKVADKILREKEHQ